MSRTEPGAVPWLFERMWRGEALPVAVTLAGLLGMLALLVAKARGRRRPAA